jgi:hypothetical protein
MLDILDWDDFFLSGGWEEDGPDCEGCIERSVMAVSDEDDGGTYLELWWSWCYSVHGLLWRLWNASGGSYMLRTKGTRAVKQVLWQIVIRI